MSAKTEAIVHRASRFSAGLPSGILNDDGTEHPCEALNLSRTGLLLVGAPQTDAGVQLRIAIRTVAGDLELLTTVDVKRCFPHPEDPEILQLGVEFRDLVPTDSETLESLLARVIEGKTPASIAALPMNASPQEIRAALEKVPIPHRQAMAQRGSMRERELLLQDSNPRVLDALARNPQLTPGEAQALLRMPQLMPQTLETFARDGRWRSSESMVMAIAAHRSAPFHVGDMLSSGMRVDQLRKLVAIPGLNAGLRRKILGKLPKR